MSYFRRAAPCSGFPSWARLWNSQKFKLPLGTGDCHKRKPKSIWILCRKESIAVTPSFSCSIKFSWILQIRFLVNSLVALCRDGVDDGIFKRTKTFLSIHKTEEAQSKAENWEGESCQPQQLGNATQIRTIPVGPHLAEAGRQMRP